MIRPPGMAPPAWVAACARVPAPRTRPGLRGRARRELREFSRARGRVGPRGLLIEHRIAVPVLCVSFRSIRERWSSRQDPRQFYTRGAVREPPPRSRE